MKQKKKNIEYQDFEHDMIKFDDLIRKLHRPLNENKDISPDIKKELSSSSHIWVLGVLYQSLVTSCSNSKSKPTAEVLHTNRRES